MHGKLKAPSRYWKLSKCDKKRICNGCGPGKWGSLIVPNRLKLIGVDFTECCNIHDFCYYGWVPKKEADNMFFDNMTIEAEKAYWGFKWFAHRCAFLYYLAVKHCGAGCYGGKIK